MWRGDVAYGFEPRLPALSDWCGFLVVACVGGPRTRHLVDAEVLTALGPQGLVVDIARSSKIARGWFIEQAVVPVVRGRCTDQE